MNDKVYYQVKVDGARFYERYDTIEKAKRWAQKVANSKKFNEVLIIKCVEKSMPICYVKPNLEGEE